MHHIGCQELRGTTRGAFLESAFFSGNHPAPLAEVSHGF